MDGGTREIKLRIEAIEKLLRDAWSDVERDEDSLVVGESNGTDIYRIPAIYTPVNDGYHDDCPPE